jgi:hypothetical protein
MTHRVKRGCDSTNLNPRIGDKSDNGEADARLLLLVFCCGVGGQGGGALVLPVSLGAK